MDSTTQSRILLLHPKVRDEVTTLITQADAALTSHSQVRIVQGLRTFAEQDALYAQGRTTPGQVVTHSRGGASYHNYGIAIDFALLIDGTQISWDTKKDFDSDGVADWTEVINIFQNAGWTWGGSWGDNPHFEKKFGHTWQDLLAKYKAHNFIPGTTYVNL